jgi:hypothetical protein
MFPAAVCDMFLGAALLTAVTAAVTAAEFA